MGRNIGHAVFLGKDFFQESHLFRLAPHVIRTGGFGARPLRSALHAPKARGASAAAPPAPYLRRRESGAAGEVCGKRRIRKSAAGRQQAKQPVLASPSKQRPTSSTGFNPPTRAAGAGKGQRGATAPPALADRSLFIRERGETLEQAPQSATAGQRQHG
ncbi:MAG: hypothetical protein PHD48_11775 [Alphaproteobacteria bacterium]|nr:hypothetical protein [Alphaproteobacteria bacterium]